MRVTGGRYRGRQVRCPPGEIRPSMDRLRQSVFSILGDLTGCSFLDLFSGSGVVGIEAASRGAEPVVLVEADPRKRPAITANLSFVATRTEVVTVRAERFLAEDARRFDYIFLDPPFALAGKEGLLDAAAAHLAAGGIAVMHFHRAESLEAERPMLEEIDRRRYGQSQVVFWRLRAAERPGPPAEAVRGPGGGAPPGVGSD
jgi:16S rRNA (guanine966-N2)-methyltransferase